MATPRLLVRNIGPSSTTDDLRRLFGKYGYVKDVHIPSSLNNRGQRFAFIEFDNARDSESAFDVLNNTTIDGYAIYVKLVLLDLGSLLSVNMLNHGINILLENSEILKSTTQFLK
jgi:RNA recognition motif-containing protein